VAATRLERWLLVPLAFAKLDPCARSRCSPLPLLTAPTSLALAALLASRLEERTRPPWRLDLLRRAPCVVSRLQEEEEDLLDRWRGTEVFS
jgi:hypothetical protein